VRVGTSGVRSGAWRAQSGVRSGAQDGTSDARCGAQVQLPAQAQVQLPAWLSNSTGSAKSLIEHATAATARTETASYTLGVKDREAP
jgi:hypothetical protein